MFKEGDTSKRQNMDGCFLCFCQQTLRQNVLTKENESSS